MWSSVDWSISLRRRNSHTTLTSFAEIPCYEKTFRGLLKVSAFLEVSGFKSSLNRFLSSWTTIDRSTKKKWYIIYVAWNVFLAGLVLQVTLLFCCVFFWLFCWQLGSTASLRPAGGEWSVVLKINEQILRAHESSPLFSPVKYRNISYLPVKWSGYTHQGYWQKTYLVWKIILWRTLKQKNERMTRIFELPKLWHYIPMHVSTWRESWYGVRWPNTPKR